MASKMLDATPSKHLQNIEITMQRNDMHPMSITRRNNNATYGIDWQHMTRTSIVPIDGKMEISMHYNKAFIRGFLQ